MSRITLPSPSKINLYLKVQNRRPDGFHNIVTLFERIDLSDEMTLRVTPHRSIRIRCDHPDVPEDARNLAHKAARLLQETAGVRQGADIHIKKNIPVAAGLAGGSGNSATALLGLNRVWKLGLKKPQLLSLAGKLGSDVPFFLHDTSWGLGTERGDRIKALNINRKLWHILVVPRLKLYAYRVYGGLRFKKRAGTNLLTKINDDVKLLIHNLKKDSILEVEPLLANDLEREVLRLAPTLNTLKQRLKSLNAKGVMVSGSGPGVFGVTADQQEAENMRSVLSRRYSQVFVVRTH